MVRPTAWLTAAGLAGQAFVIVRTLFVAGQIGTSSSLDALLVALVLPLIASGLLVSSLRTAIVPAYLEIAHERGERHAQAFVGAIVTWIAILGVLIVMVLALVPLPAIAIAGPGLDAVSRAMAIRFLPIVAPILVLSAVSTMLGALCQTKGRYLPIALGVLLAPMASLTLTVGLWDRIGLDALALGMVLGELTTLTVTISYVVWSGMAPPLRFRADRSQVARFLRHALPLSVGSGVLQINLLADRAIASLLSSGAVSALTYGQQLVLSPFSSVSYAWTLVVYPTLVRAAQDGAPAALGVGATRAIRATLAVFIPVAVTVAALAPLLVDVVYRRGAFDVRAAGLTVGVVAAFAPMLLAAMIQPILTGAHNARRHGALLALVAVANALLNLLLNVVFGLAIGVAGIALSTSLTVVVLLAFLAWRLGGSEQGFALRAVITVGGKALVASLIPGIPVALAAWLWLPPLSLAPAAATLAILLLAALGGYLATARMISLEEPWTILVRAGRQIGFRRAA